MENKVRKILHTIGVVFAVFVIMSFALLLFVFISEIQNSGSDSQFRSEMAIRSWNEKHKTPEPVTPDPYIVPSTLDIPCVGMRESDINYTKHPKILRKTTDSYVGRTHYVYYSDAVAALDIPCTLSLQCTDGVVTEVNDYRDNPLPIMHYKPKNKGSSGSKKTDAYYGDAEAFYYDHIDEFEDMDEAEEYYYELFQ